MIDKIIDRYPDGFYVFNEDKLLDNFADLKKSFGNFFPKFSIAYSFKTNYTPYLCNLLKGQYALAEVVSEMELLSALKLGFHGDNIIFNGPFKSIKSIGIAIHNNVIIHIDSKEELLLIVEQRNKFYSNSHVQVGIRTNFELEGFPKSRFGLNENDLVDVLRIINGFDFLILKGLHCHHPHRNLKSFEERMEKLASLCIKFNLDIEYLDIGGGFYGQMPEVLKSSLNIEAPTFNEYAEVIYKSLIRIWDRRLLPRLIIEPGSALVANTFDFYTRVVSVKDLGDRFIATVSGSKFNIVPNSKNIINLPIENISIPSDNNNFENSNYDICGYTCIENDVLYKGYLGNLEVGNILKFMNVGSYSIVMKPPFILPNYPIFTFSRAANDFLIIKYEESFDYLFQNFNYDL